MVKNRRMATMVRSPGNGRCVVWCCRICYYWGWFWMRWDWWIWFGGHECLHRTVVEDCFFWIVRFNTHSLAFCTESSVTLVGGASLVCFRSDAPISTGSSAAGSGRALHLASGSTIGGSESLFGGRGGVSFPLDSRRFTASGSVAMSNTDSGVT